MFSLNNFKARFILVINILFVCNGKVSCKTDNLVFTGSRKIRLQEGRRSKLVFFKRLINLGKILICCCKGELINYRWLLVRFIYHEHTESNNFVDFIKGNHIFSFLS